MINIENSIKKEILDNHWEYFKTSKGYLKLVELSTDNKIDIPERALYLYLVKNEIKIKNLVLGTPKELNDIIKVFNDEICSRIPALKLLEAFDSLTNWEKVRSTINRKAINEYSKETVIIRRKLILEKLSKIDNDLFNNGLTNSLISLVNYDTLEESKHTITLIEEYYKKINVKLSDIVKKINNRIRSIFNYKVFINSTKVWGAYKLTEALGVNICPYCNRNYVHTLEKDKGKTRPELDHYYPQSRFPFLSLSIYNLIPSCHICNSNFKGSIDFYEKKHIHPYEDNLSDKFIFYIKMKNENDVTLTIPQLDDFSIKMDTTTDDSDEIDKIENSKKTFRLEELYDFHKDIAQEVLTKSIFYNETRLKELRDFKDSNGKEIFNDVKDVSRYILCNYTADEDLGKRTLAKFTKDIASKTSLKDIL